jgi:alpha-tubulin suppressor-like RCC1 family protein
MENTVYCNAWGLASKGQLGSAYHSLKSLNALKIPNLQDGSNAGYFEAACGENHTLLLTDQLEILSCGSNTYGQLGIGSSQTGLVSAFQQQM